MNINNIMEGVFDVLHHGESKMPSCVHVAKNEYVDGMTGRVNVPPKTRMEGLIAIKQPEPILKEYTPIKDAYVYEGEATLNYGKKGILKIGTDENGLRYRSFIDFDISDIPRNMFIAKVTLELSCYDDFDFKYFEISSSKNEFEEYGITWMTQTKRDKLFKIQTLDGEARKYSIDVTQEVAENWYDKPHMNHGFILKSGDEKLKQIKEFLSANSYQPPKLKVIYMDIGSYEYGKAKMDGIVCVKLNKNDKGLIGSVVVNRYTDQSIRDGFVHVRNLECLESRVDVSLSAIKGTGRVRTYEKLGGNIHVSVPGKPSEIKGKAEINHNIMKGKLHVRKAKTLFGKVLIRNYKNLKSSLIVNQNCFKAIVDIKEATVIIGKIGIRGYEEGLSSKLTVNQNCQRGEGHVRGITPLESTTYIIRRKKKNIKGKMFVSRDAIKGYAILRTSSSIGSTANIKAQKQLVSTVKVKLEDEKVLSSNCYIREQRGIAGRVKVNGNTFEGKVTIRAVEALFTSSDIRGCEKIVASSSIRAKEDLAGFVKVKKYKYSDLKCSAQIDSRFSNKNYAFIL